MATYYVHSTITGADAGGVTGADTSATEGTGSGNTGTAADPFRTLTQLYNTVTWADGDTVYCAGRHYLDKQNALGNPALVDRAGIYITDGKNITITQWPGKIPFVIYACENHSSGWTDLGGGRYEKTIAGLGAAGNVVAVVFDYDLSTNIDSQGRHKAHYKVAANAAAVTGGGAQGQWYYDGTKVTIGMHSGAASPNAPAANGVGLVVKGQMGIGFITSRANLNASDVSAGVGIGNTVSGITVNLTCDCTTASPWGSAIYIQNGSGCRVANCTINDSGLHGISCGNRVLNMVTSANTFTTQGANSSPMVFDASGTTDGVNNSSTATSTGDLVYAGSLLGHDGNPIVSGATVRGCEVHGLTTSVEFQNLRIVQYIPPSDSGHPISGSGTSASIMDSCNIFDVSNDTDNSPSDPLNPETYPVRFRQTDPSILLLDNGTHDQNAARNSTAAFINCRINLSHTFNSGYGNVFDHRSMTGTWGFFGCEVVAALFVSGGNNLFVGGPTANYVLVNTSVYDTRTYTGGFTAYNAAGDTFAKHYVFYFNAGTGNGCVVKAYGNVFGSRLAGTGSGQFQLCHGDGTYADATKHIFRDNVYFNISSTTWADNTAWDTKAEFITAGVVDANGIDNGTTLAYADSTGVSLAPTAAAKALRKYLATHAARGVNGRAYSQQYGAYQYGSGGHRVPRAPRAFRLHRV